MWLSLCSEQEILKEEITSLQAAKDKLKAKVAEIEDELKKTREALEKEKQKASGAPEEGEVGTLRVQGGMYRGSGGRREG